MTNPCSLPEALLEGRHEPMGALARDGGVNIAVWSEHAQRIELCVFDAEGREEQRRYALHGPVDGVFHGFLPGAGPGLVYGLRAHGPWEPACGHRFEPDRVLLDPWAREIIGSAPDGLRARVAAPPGPAAGAFNAPRIAPQDMVLYEVHVKGFSMTHPDIPLALAGSYAALAHPAAIAHFKALGVTTLSLLPVQHHLDEPALAARGATNYWGYNTLGFFAADPRFALRSDDPAAANDEFRRMVATLHAHGLEVVLDVVYNHTAEGGDGGPTLSWRGLDNASWYRLQPDGRCENLTGCGNTVRVAHPRVTQFVLDSLRFWVQEMGVDGFRFDLAPVLGRTDAGYDPHAAFFTALRQDPVLSRVHLIAEPWDAAPDGYQVGRFPGRFMEWNDQFRDTVRAYWLGQPVEREAMARRLGASPDLFGAGRRRPWASVNFLSVHDGFTLHDVVSYSRKHNHANDEDNRDGRDGELCANFGAEGDTDDAQVQALRQRVRRAMMATLLLAQGTPMLCAGDEIGNSQQGNNNAYCQDNALGWLNWERADDAFCAFVAELLALRRATPALRSAEWGQGARVRGFGHRGLLWQVPGDERLVLALNPDPCGAVAEFGPGRWQVLLDSAGELARGVPFDACLTIPARALVVLRAHSDSDEPTPSPR